MSDASPAPAAVPGAPPTGGDPVQSSGGAGGAPGGVLPPSASAPPAGQNVHPAGLHAVGMEGMRKLMGAMHMFKAMLDPSSEESKAADKMFMAGRKHFVPDQGSAQSGQMPPMNTGMGQPGQPPGMRGPQGGNQVPMIGQQNLPTGPVPMRAAA